MIIISYVAMDLFAKLLRYVIVMLLWKIHFQYLFAID